MPDLIASPRNPLLKEIRKAIGRGALTTDGFAVAESFHLLEEAIRSRCEIRAVLASESAAKLAEGRLDGAAGLLRLLPDALFAEIAATETSQGVITLVKPPEWTLDGLFTSVPLLVALDGVQDPGNAGAIVRSAEAFGASGVLFLKGTVSPFNPKTLRASAGSLFRVPFLQGWEPEAIQDLCQKKSVQLCAAVPGAARPLTTVTFAASTCIVIGSEGNGVSESLRRHAQLFTIPTRGVESLNAAVAASIILYEAARQRTQ